MGHAFGSGRHGRREPAIQAGGLRLQAGGRFQRIGRALLLTLAVFGAALAGGLLAGPAQAQRQTPPELQQSPTGGHVPGDALGTASDADLWRAVRGGVSGTVNIPDKKAALLIQSQGDNWRAFRNGPLSTYGAWALLGTVIILALFFALRGRIMIEKGPAGVTITRFSWIERTGHWLVGVSFIVLAVTGLNLLYGRYVLKPVIGADAFALITHWGKYAHNYLAFAFIAGLVMIFVMWVSHNIPSRIDIAWILKAGGLFSKNVHPDSRKFNAGQKIIFWAVIVGGVSVAVSGWALLFPFTTHLFSGTFEVVNAIFGTSLPTNLAPIHEQQLAQGWHAILALLLTCVILAHIYIGSVGMEGAFDAMGSGEVDLNWAKEHHNLWVEEVQEREAGRAEAQPAE
ncbi:formate dehydrogenase gamma subunit [Breoghania corrubedonensis]|uniref:Formate dehydrogenase gamma subunit n=1 Tax=Breoghania corrubedonensis TaxID=665038 RepID=A0A2T5VAS4_9HYPH|nr:formate dehydrogenase subunit gamma [Breoghania corrubedonensis]PTW60844.1 formate dehydrogenase gamma subunit [Breoghania corrubedonensis]